MLLLSAFLLFNWIFFSPTHCFISREQEATVSNRDHWPTTMVFSLYKLFVSRFLQNYLKTDYIFLFSFSVFSYLALVLAVISVLDTRMVEAGSAFILHSVPLQVNLHEHRKHPVHPSLPTNPDKHCILILLLVITFNNNDDNSSSLTFFCGVCSKIKKDKKTQNQLKATPGYCILLCTAQHWPGRAQAKPNDGEL